MSHIVELTSFTLKAGVSEQDFFLAHKRFNEEFMVNQAGYVSHKLLKDDKEWHDLAVWSSMEEKERAFSDVNAHPATIEYMKFIDQIGTDDDIPIFSVVKVY